MTRRLPLLPIALGLAGLIPFVACGLGALGMDVARAGRAELALVAYGAVILAFLGGVHWGLALHGLDEPVERRADRVRYALGVVPSLIGWAALLVSLVTVPWIGLALLIGGFAAVTLVEARGARAGLLPSGYMWLRWLLSAGVLIALIGVLFARLFGVHVDL